MNSSNKNTIGCMKPMVRGTFSSLNIVIIKKRNMEYVAIASKSFYVKSL